MGNQQPPPPQLSEEEERSVFDYDVTVRSLASAIRRLEADGEAGVVVMAGAGISVSAGIPDFRTPGTGLYDNLEKYNLPSPESMFDMEYFKENPEPFNTLAKEMFPGNYKPTPTHFFIKLLEAKGVLKRCFTQNIDTLEREAGISTDLLVEAHGSFGDAHCIECKLAHSQEWIKDVIFKNNIPHCTRCNGLVKPDIVFFGENLPSRFFQCREADIPAAKVLIVMGTSLSVSPFCLLVNEVNPLCPRLLINYEKVGERDHSGHGFRFNTTDNYRDAAILSTCDDGVRALCDELGWREELEALIAEASTDMVSTTPCLSEEVILKQWRRPRPPMPPIQPFSEGPTEGAFSCTLVEPSSWEEVVGGRPAFFHVTVPPERQGKENDFLCLIPQNAKEPGERTDRSFAFMPDCTPTRMRLRLPWIRLELPWYCEVWYVDPDLDAPVARWGPIEVKANAPEDVKEEEGSNQNSSLAELDDSELEGLIKGLSAQLGVPEDFARTMIMQNVQRAQQDELPPTPEQEATQSGGELLKDAAESGVVIEELPGEE